jgi:hypothetical protein
VLRSGSAYPGTRKATAILIGGYRCFEGGKIGDGILELIRRDSVAVSAGRLPTAHGVKIGQSESIPAATGARLRTRYQPDMATGDAPRLNGSWRQTGGWAINLQSCSTSGAPSHGVYMPFSIKFCAASPRQAVSIPEDGIFPHLITICNVQSPCNRTD